MSGHVVNTLRCVLFFPLKVVEHPFSVLGLDLHLHDRELSEQRVNERCGRGATEEHEQP